MLAMWRVAVYDTAISTVCILNEVRGVGIYVDIQQNPNSRLELPDPRSGYIHPTIQTTNQNPN
jgi:hypothetical protein